LWASGFPTLKYSCRWAQTMTRRNRSPSFLIMTVPPSITLSILAVGASSSPVCQDVGDSQSAGKHPDILLSGWMMGSGGWVQG
jgi:hypothetical protein